MWPTRLHSTHEQHTFKCICNDIKQWESKSAISYDILFFCRFFYSRIKAYYRLAGNALSRKIRIVHCKFPLVQSNVIHVSPDLYINAVVYFNNSFLTCCKKSVFCAAHYVRVRLWRTLHMFEGNKLNKQALNVEAVKNVTVISKCHFTLMHGKIYVPKVLLKMYLDNILPLQIIKLHGCVDIHQPF